MIPFLQGGAAAPGVNATTLLDGLLPALHANDYSELVFWVQADLYGYADDAVKRLARSCGGFVERDAGTNVAAGTASYAVPARHVETLHVSVGTRALRPANVPEMEARDDAWDSQEATLVDPLPTHWLMDVGRETHRLYPEPFTGASGALAVVMLRTPVTVTAATAIVRMPAVLRPWWRLRVLEAAREKEGQGQMQEVARWAGQVAALLEQTVRGLWQLGLGDSERRSPSHERNT